MPSKITRSFDFARATGISLQRVKHRAAARKEISPRLTDGVCCGNTARPEAMTTATDIHSAARLSPAARGLVSILLVVILPL
jgi:hypothetical protein